MGLITRTLVKIRKAKKEREEKEIRHALLARNKANKEAARQEAFDKAKREEAAAKARRKAAKEKAGPSSWEKLGRSLVSSAKKYGKQYAKTVAARERAERRTARPKRRKTKRG